MGYSPRPRRYAMPKRNARLVSGGGSAMAKYRKVLARELKLINDGSAWRVTAVKLARGVNNFPLFSLRVEGASGATYGFVLEPKVRGDQNRANWRLQEVSACCGVKNAALASTLESSESLKASCCKAVVAHLPAPYTLNAKYMNVNLSLPINGGLNDGGLVTYDIAHTRGKLSVLTDLFALRFSPVEPNLLEAQLGAAVIAEAIFALLNMVDEDPFTAAPTFMFTGPTGSGKSTTMAALINQINAAQKQSGKTVKLHSPASPNLNSSTYFNPLQGP